MSNVDEIYSLELNTLKSEDFRTSQNLVYFLDDSCDGSDGAGEGSDSCDSGSGDDGGAGDGGSAGGGNEGGGGR